MSESESNANLLDAMRSHFRERRSGLLAIDVPEWGGKVYFSPAVTAIEYDRYMAPSREGRNAESVVLQFIIRARSADGKRLFPGDAEHVVLDREIDFQVVDRVVGRMLELSGQARRPETPSEDERGN